MATTLEPHARAALLQDLAQEYHGTISNLNLPNSPTPIQNRSQWKLPGNLGGASIGTRVLEASSHI